MQNAFEPHEIATLARVTDKACTEMRAHNDARRTMIAECVLAYAAEGESDPDALLSLVLTGRGSSSERELPEQPG